MSNTLEVLFPATTDDSFGVGILRDTFLIALSSCCSKQILFSLVKDTNFCTNCKMLIVNNTGCNIARMWTLLPGESNRTVAGLDQWLSQLLGVQDVKAMVTA